MCLFFILGSLSRFSLFPFFFFNDTATTEIYTLSLHDALPIYRRHSRLMSRRAKAPSDPLHLAVFRDRSEEHTSELQSHSDLVCRLLLEKKKKKKKRYQQSVTKSRSKKDG